MSGVDTVRGIGYQHAHAVLVALDVLDDLDLAGLRIEGVDDVVDIELLTVHDTVRHAIQVKTRAAPYTWSATDIVGVLCRWAALPNGTDASFEFLTDGRLGRVLWRTLAVGKGETADQAFRAALATIIVTGVPTPPSP